MRRISLILILFILIQPSLALCSDVVQQEIGRAIVDGRNLYEAYLKGPISGEDIEKEKSRIGDFCGGFRYQAFRANGDVYFIAEQPIAGTIVFGRHYRVKKQEIVKSTISCFASTEQPGNAVAAYVTHLLSDTPSEFHVFVSLVYGKVVYVGTKTGIWKIHEGKIQFVEKRK